jgi:FkbM family methyltransferase
MSRLIFLDVGANWGHSVEEFLSGNIFMGENECYFDFNINKLKKINPLDFEVFAFEPMFWIDAWDHIKNKFPDNKIDFIIKAAWIKNGTILLAEIPESNISSTTNPDSNIYETAKKVEVECIDLSQWILDNFNPSDFIIMQMNIEGAEYEILKKMISDGSIKYINKLFVEFHDRKMPEKYKEIHKQIMESSPIKIVELV